MPKVSRPSSVDLTRSFFDAEGNQYKGPILQQDNADDRFRLWMRMNPGAPTNGAQILPSANPFTCSLGYSGSATTGISTIKTPSGSRGRPLRFMSASSADSTPSSSYAGSAFVLNPSGTLSFTSTTDEAAPEAGSDRPFSVSIWFKINDFGEPDPQNTNHYLFSKSSLTGSANYPFEYRAFIYGEGQIYFDIADPVNGGRERVGMQLGTRKLNRWYHAVCTYDGRGGATARNGMRIYIDGVSYTQNRASVGTYVGMVPDGSARLYVGANLRAAAPVGPGEQLEGELAELALWGRTLAADEVKALFNAYRADTYYPRSGMLGNPPRVRLQVADCTTGSYPTAARMGDQYRPGRTITSRFDDSRTIVFAAPSGTGSLYAITGTQFPLASYPTVLPQGDHLYISQSIATPNVNSDLTANAMIRKGVSDANIRPIRRGEAMSPYNDTALAIAGPTFADPFFMTGSRVQDVGLGFTSPLRSKTVLKIPLPSVRTTTFGMTSGTNIRPMVYYNFVDRAWEIIGFPIDVSDAGNNAAAAQVKNDGIMSGACVGFSRGMEMLYDNPRVNCQPISSFGFPMNGRYHATSSQVFRMSKLIDRPFLVEKVVLRLSAAALQPSDMQYDRPCLFAYFGTDTGVYANPGKGSPADMTLRDPTFASEIVGNRDDNLGGNNRTPRARIDSFFILNQRSPFSSSIHQDVNQLNDPGTGKDVTAIITRLPSHHVLAPGDLRSSFVSSSRDMVTYLQVVGWCGGDFDWRSRYPMLGATGALNQGLARELNVYAGQYGAYAAQEMVISGTVKTTRALPQASQFRWKTYNNSTLNATRIQPANAGGRRGDAMSVTGRDLVQSVPGSPKSINPASNRRDGRYFDFGVTHGSGQGTNSQLGIPLYEDVDHVSPYLLEPGDELVIGCQAPLTWGWSRSTDGGTGPRTQLIESRDAELVLYGSLVTEGREYHETLNQPLTSDAVHEAMGALGPPLDQYDTQPRQQFSGSYISNMVTGSMIVSALEDPLTTAEASINAGGLGWSRGVKGQRSDGRWFHPTLRPGLPVPGISPKDRVNYPVRAQSFGRFVAATGKPFFYDSLAPDPVDIQNIDVGKFYQWSFPVGKQTNGAANFEAVRNRTWPAAFPFEPRYATLGRQVSSEAKLIGNSYDDPADGDTLNDPDYFRAIYFPIKGGGGNAYDYIRWLSPTGETIVAQDPIGGIGSALSAVGMKFTKMIFYAIGDGAFGEVPIRNIDPTIDQFFSNMYIRGFKYGLFHGVPQQPRAYFRWDRYGQFRDMLEPRIDTRTMVPGPESGLGAPIRVRFVDSNNKRVKPSSTESSNLSQRATSSLPYFDGISRNRGPINEAEQLTTIVSF